MNKAFEMNNCCTSKNCGPWAGHFNEGGQRCGYCCLGSCSGCRCSTNFSTGWRRDCLCDFNCRTIPELCSFNGELDERDLIAVFHGGQTFKVTLSQLSDFLSLHMTVDLTEINNKITNINSDLSAINNQINIIKSGMTDLTNEINSLKSRVTILEGLSSSVTLQKAYDGGNTIIGTNPIVFNGKPVPVMANVAANQVYSLWVGTTAQLPLVRDQFTIYHILA